MARKPRLEVEPALVHVYARGNEKRDIFRSDADRLDYVRRLGDVTTRQRWRCYAYCLMGNHVHLLVETVVPNLAEGMRCLHGGYAQEFNRRYDRVGHLFQGRYGAVSVTDEAQLATTVGYIATNPVAGGLVQRPEQWPWSSYPATVGAEPSPKWLAVIDLFGALASAFGGEGRDHYGSLVTGRLAASR